ncbi:hypothetical protein KAJ83_01630 [Marivibrio halodurans]|uniref:Endonuclease n=1 Tax=Marivibrio halodurans TaxID=2039722 RepID=A0A8J7SJL5_9PROT|nr:hypothetical protein [Marivibrio halodurans]MBP5855693.1 hypothetical protein [Marivibrio halodurans]
MSRTKKRFSREEWRYVRKRFRDCRAEAKRRGLAFDLTLEEIEFPRRCPALGVHLSYLPPQTRGKKRPEVFSFERLDNDFGYVPGNVVIVSHKANSLKSDLSAEQLLRAGEFFTRHVQRFHHKE